MPPTFSIFLSASVPQKERSAEYRVVANAALQIEDAVVALARQVFKAGGRLVFGGHPSISPLVASVAAEYVPVYRTQSKGEGNYMPVVIYQSRFFEKEIPQSTTYLSSLGVTETIWTDVDLPDDRSVEARKRSLTKMRRQMISEQRPDAMVAMGGMEGVEEEVSLFSRLREGAPLYLFKTTGGAAYNIATAQQLNYGIVQVPDMDEATLVAEMDGEANKIRFNTAPYTLYSARMVQQLLNNKQY